jgi:hypothetical protein
VNDDDAFEGCRVGGHTYDLDAMAAAVTDRTRLIFVCNPNNPTSTVVDPGTTATMVYDGQPTHDHFKKIDDNTVMGIMNGKHVVDDGRYFYFYLERAEQPTEDPTE